VKTIAVIETKNEAKNEAKTGKIAQSFGDRLLPALSCAFSVICKEALCAFEKLVTYHTLSLFYLYETKHIF
jgi:hypothetical protein